jgi:hypothetical protein
MDRAQVVGLVDRVLDARAASVDRDGLKVGLAAAERLARWVEAQRVALAAALGSVAAFPDHDIAETTGSGLRDAAKTLERAKLVDDAPSFGSALSE